MTDFVLRGATTLQIQAAAWAARLGYGDRDCCNFVAFVCSKGKVNQPENYPVLMREYLAETRD